MASLWIVLLLTLFSPFAVAAQYTGSESCQQCHQQAYQDWATSHHQAAMLKATEESVLADFNNTSFTYGKITSTFYRKGKAFWVKTENALGQLEDFKISYTFGVFPLQQYIVDFDDGRKQVLSIIWDSRPASQGGQRWYHLYPEHESLSHGLPAQSAVDSNDPLHWTGTQFNWNTRCASCHSTGLVNKFDIKTNTFNTTWNEINVSCESCHGSGKDHIGWARSESQPPPQHFGFKHTISNPALWQYPNARHRIKYRSSSHNPHQVDVCAHCHSRRQELSQWEPDSRFADQHIPRLIEAGLYYPDGQMLDEVYVYGSFMQSKMHAKGVVCSDCHNPHSLALKKPGNQVCSQCHNPEVFDTVTHHHHTDEKSSQCVNCHMTETTYMGVDARRDHSFRVPDPLLSHQVGSPDACTSCHTEQTPAWATKAIQAWVADLQKPQQKPEFATTFMAADQGINKDKALLNIANDGGYSAIVRASAALRLSPNQVANDQQSIADLLNDESWMIRLGTVRSVMQLPVLQRWQLLSAHLDEPVRAVRYEIARALAGLPLYQLAKAQSDKVQMLYKEFITNSEFNSGMPDMQVILGLFSLNQQDSLSAETYFRQALTITPDYQDALLNLADLYRATGRDDKAGDLLKLAVKAHPNAVDPHYALALWYVRQKSLPEAQIELQKAYEIQPGFRPTTLALALVMEQLNQREKAYKLVTSWLNTYGSDPQLEQLRQRLGY
ncbi:tetratricopeptide repeat protein [Photobacterium sp. SP02]|uniref:tetratricopeptide repeat protein n=1 Tax=Photobacterium sp. SP02 TaxID=3032280 RepID=UPI00314519F5